MDKLHAVLAAAFPDTAAKAKEIPPVDVLPVALEPAVRERVVAELEKDTYFARRGDLFDERLDDFYAKWANIERANNGLQTRRRGTGTQIGSVRDFRQVRQAEVEEAKKKRQKREKALAAAAEATRVRVEATKSELVKVLAPVARLHGSGEDVTQPGVLQNYDKRKLEGAFDKLTKLSESAGAEVNRGFHEYAEVVTAAEEARLSIVKAVPMEAFAIAFFQARKSLSAVHIMNAASLVPDVQPKPAAKEVVNKRKETARIFKSLWETVVKKINRFARDGSKLVPNATKRSKVKYCDVVVLCRFDYQGKYHCHGSHDLVQWFKTKRARDFILEGLKRPGDENVDSAAAAAGGEAGAAEAA